MGYVTCTDCNRVLRFEHGPTCPECLAKRVEEAEEALDAYPPEVSSPTDEELAEIEALAELHPEPAPKRKARG